MRYETVIGLETHAELATESKLWCPCSTRFGRPPNTQTCPVCLGMPGVLPVLNKRAFELAAMAAIAMHCTINRTTFFDRKNYYYPDLPKNYQVSQNYCNLGVDGYLEIPLDGAVKRVGIWNVHLEEDAGKNIHAEHPGADYSLVDLNRAGTPLLEIVSGPDMRSVQEAEAFMRTLRQILLYSEVSDCKMQEGKLRFEPSISLRPAGQEELGARVEVKNVGSITAVVKAVEFEVKRQSELLDAGDSIAQETRLWSERLDRTATMRRKETSADYRYFPEPDLVPVEITSAWMDELRNTLPEMPVARRLRFQRELGLGEYEAAVLTDDHALADYFEASLAAGSASPKSIATWVINDVLRILNEKKIGVSEFKCPPCRISALATLVEKGELSFGAAREVFSEMVESDREPDEIVKAKVLTQVNDESALTDIVDRVLAANEKIVADWKSGKKAAANALIGPVMRETKGTANPKMVREILQQRLAAR